ncbi:MAG: hypothetical protein II565_13095 [Fibrobacter sp.]|nr:hypothetical protein [Fibrobacter sp.]
MRKLNKIILAGLATILVSCSSEQSSTGATTEPSTSPVALTEEQKAILAKSLFSLMDPTMGDSLKNLFDSAYASSGYDVNKMYNDYISPYPWSVKNTQVYRHPSKDERKVCDVVTYSRENGNDQKGVLLATSYDDEQLCSFSSVTEPKCTSIEAAEDYFYNHPHETVTNTKIVDVDGIPVVINTIGSLEMRNGFWGYGATCVETLNKFKQSCDSSNGLFWDLGDGCSQDDLELVCASFVPENKTPDQVLASYTESYLSRCYEDSIRYAPYDDENYNRIYPYWDQTYLDSLNRIAYAERDWTNSLKRSTSAYRWQFSIIDSTIQTAVKGSDTYVIYKEYPELMGYLGYGYNTLPSTPIADAYRNEGVYVLPDSLLTTFFPKLAEYPGRLDEFRQYRSPKNSIYYLIVLKDVGAKGHLLNGVYENEIRVTDIVKSGNCPEDTTVHYPIILLADSPDWDILNRPIVKTTIESDKWNCDQPETLAKIEPYGEWILSKMTDYGEYVKLFGLD